MAALTQTITGTVGLIDTALSAALIKPAASTGLTDGSLSAALVTPAVNTAGLADTVGLDRSIVVNDTTGTVDSAGQADTALANDTAGQTDSVSIATALAVTDSSGASDLMLTGTALSGGADDPLNISDVGLSVQHDIVVDDTSGLHETTTAGTEFLLIVLDLTGGVDAASTAATGAKASSATDITTMSDTFTVSATLAHIFTPPTRAYTPSILPSTPEWQRSPARYFPRTNIAKPANVYKLVDGSYTEVESGDDFWARVAVAYYGGHTFVVDAVERSALIAAGYGADVS